LIGPLIALVYSARRLASWLRISQLSVEWRGWL
jgi:hypothetical protein